MKKNIAGRKLSRNTNERKQLFRNLIKSLVEHGFIVTTIAKAKAVKPNFEKLVTLAKDGKLANFRRLIKKTGDIETARKILLLGKLFLSRRGGYTRIVKLGNLSGDNSQSVKFELVEKLTQAEVVKPAKSQEKSKTEKTVLPKKKQESSLLKPTKSKNTKKLKNKSK